MKREKLAKTLVGVWLALVLAFILPFVNAEAQVKPTPGPGWRPPASISIGAAGTTTIGYPTAVGMTSKIGEATGVKFSVIPADRALERALLLRKGETVFNLDTAVNMLFALRGTEEYKEWGPQSIRVVWLGGVVAQGVATRASAGVRKWSDLIGKRVATYPYHASIQHQMEASLAYANLSWKDVVPVPMSSMPAGMKALLAGTVVAASMSAESSSAYELAASVHGIHWLPLPNITPEDKAAWARFQKVLPYFPLRTTRAAGASEEKPADIWGFYYHVVAFDDTDRELVYWFTKQVHENYAAYKTISAYLATWTLEECLKSEAWFVPWHEGSVKYLKEIGRWTPEMEAKQQRMLSMFPQTMTRPK